MSMLDSACQCPSVPPSFPNHTAILGSCILVQPTSLLPFLFPTLLASFFYQVQIKFMQGSQVWLLLCLCSLISPFSLCTWAPKIFCAISCFPEALHKTLKWLTIEGVSLSLLTRGHWCLLHVSPVPHLGFCDRRTHSVAAAKTRKLENSDYVSLLCTMST